MALALALVVLAVGALGALVVTGKIGGSDGSGAMGSGRLIFPATLVCGDAFSWDVQLPASTGSGAYDVVLTGTTKLGTWGGLVTLDASHTDWQQVDEGWRKSFGGQLDPVYGCSGNKTRGLSFYAQGTSDWVIGKPVTAGSTYTVSVVDAQNRTLAEGSFSVA